MRPASAPSPPKCRSSPERGLSTRTTQGGHFGRLVRFEGPSSIDAQLPSWFFDRALNECEPLPKPLSGPENREIVAAPQQSRPPKAGAPRTTRARGFPVPIIVCSTRDLRVTFLPG